MSLGSETVKHSIFRSSLVAALIALSGEAAAIGLGELRGRVALGDKPRFEVDILVRGRLRLLRLVSTTSVPAAKSSAPIIATLRAWPGAATRRSAPRPAHTCAR